MRLLVVNADQHSRDTILQSVPGTAYQLAEARGKAQALQLLATSADPVIVIVDFPLALWQDSGDIVAAVAGATQLAEMHSFILLLYTNETVPLNVGRALSRLTVKLVAKPINKPTLLTALKAAAHDLNERDANAPTRKMPRPEPLSKKTPPDSTKA